MRQAPEVLNYSVGTDERLHPTNSRTDAFESLQLGRVLYWLDTSRSGRTLGAPNLFDSNLAAIPARSLVLLS